MKSFRKLFIAALALLFGPWVDMQAQHMRPYEPGTLSKFVRHKSPKSLKQKRAGEFISRNSEVIQMGNGVSVSFVLSADCRKNNFFVTIDQITVTVPDAPPFLLGELENYIHEKNATLNDLEKAYEYLKPDRPGESEEKYAERHEKLEKLRKEMTSLRDTRDSALKTESAMFELLGRFAQYIISGE